MKRAWLFACGSSDKTLRPGAVGVSGHGALPAAATLRGYRLNASASVLVRDSGSAVRGTLLEVPAEAVAALDAGGDDRFPSLPTLRNVRDAAGRRRKAWVFLRPAPGAIEHDEA